MAEEQSFLQGQKREQYLDLDEQLASYYGSALPEQPLPASCWQQVRSQLGSRPRSRSRRGPALTASSRLRGTSLSIPPYISQAFFRVAYDARVPIARMALNSRFKAHVRVPAVHISPPGRGTIRLTLPASAMLAMEPQLLDVLLATGMARLLYARKISYRLGNLLLLGLVLLAAITCLILWLQDHLSPPEFLIAVGLWLATAVLQHVRGRRMALRADDLMVQWLGRERACQGLRMLADRSRGVRSGRWREPSLAVRIARVCGTRVEAEDERLTLVR